MNLAGFYRRVKMGPSDGPQKRQTFLSPAYTKEAPYCTEILFFHQWAISPFDGLVRQEGFEPPTFSFEGCCSIQLSYWRKQEDDTEHAEYMPFFMKSQWSWGEYHWLMTTPLFLA